jgi:SNF2 family DNA or RNA helicase
MKAKQLRPYQEKAIEYWLKNKKVYFAIDMGLGKTAIVLHTINQLNLPTLIIAPLTVMENTWPDEIYDWDLQAELSFQALHGNNKKLDFSKQVHIINYDGLPWLYKKLYDLHRAKKPIPYKVLVLDESTFVKSNTSNRFGLLCAMRDLFKYIALLSGTPSPNSLLDLWSQYYIIDKGESLGDNFNSFRDKYFTKDPYRKYDWNARFGTETAIHKAISGKTFRLSSEDHIQLPERVINTIRLDLQPKERAQYKSFKKDFILLLENASVSSLNTASLSSKLRQFVQGSIYENHDDGTRTTHFIHDTKVRALKDLLESLYGRNVLCLIQFKFEIDLLQKAFPGTPFITGATKASDRNRYLKQWNNKELPLLIAHPRSVGRGLNMQKGGSVIVWFALPWSLDDYLQTNKRLHRPGQMDHVLIQHLIIKNTIDETVYQALNAKDMTQRRLLEYLRKRTMEDLDGK